MPKVCPWGTWDLPVWTPYFTGLNQPLGIFQWGQEPSLTDGWLGTSGMISNTTCCGVTSLAVSGDHPPWKAQSFISAVVQWALFTTFAERPYHQLSTHGAPTGQCSHAQSPQIKSWLLSISSLSPKPADHSALRLHYGSEIQRDSKLVSSWLLSNQSST